MRGPGELSVAKQSLKLSTYERIKALIIEGRLEGGDPIQELKLVDELGVSRTPIREALNLLQQEHLVEIYPKQGVFVSRIAYKDVVDIYSVRINLEALAVEQATARIDPDKLQELHRLWSSDYRDEDFRDHIQHDRELHTVIAAATENKYLIKYLGQLYDQASRFRYFTLKRSQDRLKQTHTEHQKILEIMISGDAASAGEAMRAHLTRARDTTLNWFR